MVAIAFVHPDLGIGGAERLVCDAALALQKKGHSVKIYTSHHDPKHCFAETADGTLSVVAIGDWLPRHVFGRCYALWAYIRMLYVSLYVVFCASEQPDIIICDQVSACLPILKISKTAKIMFYCHYPDMLLTQRHSLMKKLYRIPLDWLEEFTTGLADIILVNSKYTAKIFQKTFTSLFSTSPQVLYPSLNFESFNKEEIDCAGLLKDQIPQAAKHIFLSINRYERKKNLALAINSMKKLKEECHSELWKKVHLVMAGGYDDRVDENKSHYIELESLAARVGVKDNITFIRSFSDDEKIALLKTATCLLYTPSNEHFGIVPIEAMYMQCPVIACKSGGPLETIQHKVTGYLCEPNADEFSTAMMSFIEDNSLKDDYGKAGRNRVVQYFSFDSFTGKLDKIVNDLMTTPAVNNNGERNWLFLVCFLVAMVILYRVLLMFF